MCLAGTDIDYQNTHACNCVNLSSSFKQAASHMNRDRRQRADWFAISPTSFVCYFEITLFI